jgi:MoaA/NifB/PqqE/SkfB family radical SAM enzyme
LEKIAHAMQNTLKYAVGFIVLKLIRLNQKIAHKMLKVLSQVENIFRPLQHQETPQQVQKECLFLPTERACHFHELYITHTGDVFPCCIVWKRSEMRIGHITDEDLLEAIEAFDGNCRCEQFTLRKGTSVDPKDYLLNIELSLACQGKCAMCCVEAPHWQGHYEYYNACTNLIDRLQPKEILVQGGEVLIQKKSLTWLSEVKEKHPNINISLVTNGNVDLDMLETVERLFHSVFISIVGFQPETYERIMGMHLEKTVRFAEELAKRNTITLNLKYLITPLNVHEVNVFLEWAIEVNPASVLFFDASTFQYINPDAPFGFWDKIFERTGQKIREVLLTHRERLLHQDMTISFTNECLQVLKFNEDFEAFLRENTLSDKIGRRLLG